MERLGWGSGPTLHNLWPPLVVGIQAQPCFSWVRVYCLCPCQKGKSWLNDHLLAALQSLTNKSHDIEMYTFTMLYTHKDVSICRWACWARWMKWDSCSKSQAVRGGAGVHTQGSHDPTSHPFPLNYLWKSCPLCNQMCVPYKSLLPGKSLGLSPAPGVSDASSAPHSSSPCSAEIPYTGSICPFLGLW